MNNQEAFTAVKKHLLTQNEKAQISRTHATSCMYRTPDGKKCAIGCLIPDELYDPDKKYSSQFQCGIEGMTVEQLVFYDKDIAAFFDGVDMNLLVGLQKIHDEVVVNDWPHALYQLAQKHGLNYE